MPHSSLTALLTGPLAWPGESCKGLPTGHWGHWALPKPKKDCEEGEETRGMREEKERHKEIKERTGAADNRMGVKNGCERELGRYAKSVFQGEKILELRLLSYVNTLNSTIPEI